MQKANIKDAVIAVTYNCNSRCTMCNIWQKTDNINALGPKELANLPADLRDINITGGEPFLRGDIVEIVKALKERCPEAGIIISSNGFATDLIIEQMAKIVKIMPEIGVAISLDGMGTKHDEIRRIENGFARATTTLKKLKELGVKHLRIGFTLGDYNTEELEKVYNFANEIGVEFSLAVVHSSENFFSKQNDINNKEELIRKLNWVIKKELGSWSPKRWARAYFAYGLKYFVQNGKRILPDYSGRLSIFIDPLGNIYPNDVATIAMGKLDKDGMKIEYRKDNHESWMVCTARPAIKKHLVKVGYWIIKNKLSTNYKS